MKRSSGLTLIEVLIAVVVLGIGIVALAGGSALVTRMIGHGKVETRAAQLAARRIEALRLAANATSPRCAAPEFASGGPVIAGGVAESWVVPSTGRVRHVRVTVSYLTVRGARSAALETGIEC
ncbi:MAG: prepilin-type N-terminal cleavage/methylation domain-containing protein [Gemmatimonadales bacterium]